MKEYQEAIKAILLKYGGFREIVKAVGFLIMVDYAISVFISMIRKRFYKFKGSKYGFSEALLFPKEIDRWTRYQKVVDEMLKIKPVRAQFSVLEVGSGGEGISGFLNPSRRDCAIFLLDILRGAFKGLKRINSIIADGRMLPFKDKAFDIVVSVDVLEHIPKMFRHNFCQELRRVCKQSIIIACPMQSSDGIFQGRKYDLIFQHFYEKNFGFKEPNTEQHISAGHPTPDEIRTYFPGSVIQGYKNSCVWLKYMMFSRRLFVGNFAGLLYYLFWKKDEDKPPFWGAVITSSN